MVATTDSTVSVWSWSYLKDQLATALLNPIRAFRPRYLPLLMVYFAYGALGLIAVAESFWVKKALTLSPAELAELSGWLTLPWTVKMVFGELVDAVPILGSQRRAQLKTVHSRQHHIQHVGVVVQFVSQSPSFISIWGHVDGEALSLQATLEGSREARFIFHYEQPHPVLPGHGRALNLRRS